MPRIKIMPANIMRALIVAILLSVTLLNAADTKPERTFNDAAKELITKVRALVSEDRAKAFNQYAKGAQELAKEFPKEVGPLMMMAEASGLVQDKKLSTDLAAIAEKGVLKILKKDPKNSGANAALMRIAGSAKPEKAKALLKQIAKNGPTREAAAAKGQLTKMEALGKPVDISFKSLNGRAVDMTKLKGKVVLIDFGQHGAAPALLNYLMSKRRTLNFTTKGLK